MVGDAGNQRRGGPDRRGPRRSGSGFRPGSGSGSGSGFGFGSGSGQYRFRGDESAANRRPDGPTPPTHPEEEERAGVFRETLVLGGWQLELVSRQPVGGSWGAWVRRATGGAPPGGAETIRSMTATGATAGEALAALEVAIRAALGQPVPPVQPEGAA